MAVTVTVSVAAVSETTGLVAEMGRIVTVTISVEVEETVIVTCSSVLTYKVSRPNDGESSSRLWIGSVLLLDNIPPQLWAGFPGHWILHCESEWWVSAWSLKELLEQ